MTDDLTPLTDLHNIMVVWDNEPTAERKFNPSEPRIPGGPHGGEWGGGTVEHALKDALKLGDRIKLGQDERLVGSAKVGDGTGDYSMVLARVDGPGGPTIRVGNVASSETGRWRAENKGSTVVLDERGVRGLRSVLADAPAKGKQSVDDFRKELRAKVSAGVPESEWPDPEADIAKGVIGGSQWGDIHWNLTREEGPNYTIGGVDHGPGGKWYLGLQIKASDNHGILLDDFNITSPAAAQKLEKALADLMETPPAARAAGHDTTPGHDELHHWWTVGKGRAEWVDSPKPWTTLVANLVRVGVPLEKAKVYASRWFIEVKGYAAGSDINRVTHGKPPRGDKVGPG